MKKMPSTGFSFFLKRRRGIVCAVPAVILDVIFFYVLTRLHLEVLTKVAEHMASINEILAQKTIDFSQSASSDINTYLLATPQFISHYHAVMKLGALFVFGVLIAWIILQGGAWYLAHLGVNKKRITIHTYFLRFTLISILSTVVLAGVLFIVLGLVESGAVLPIFSEDEPFVVSAALIAVIGYFLVVLYSAPSKNGLRASIKHAYPLMFMYIGALGATALGILIGTWLFSVHWMALLVFSVFILLPSFSAYRYFFVKFLHGREIF